MGWFNRRKVNLCKHSEKALSEWRQPRKRPVGMYGVTEQQEITSCSLSSDTQPCQCKHLVQVITNASGSTAGGRILFLALWKKGQQETFLPSVKSGRWCWHCPGWHSQSKEWMLFQLSVCNALSWCYPELQFLWLQLPEWWQLSRLFFNVPWLSHTVTKIFLSVQKRIWIYSRKLALFQTVANI